jgi:hypothetical protein
MKTRRTRFVLLVSLPVLILSGCRSSQSTASSRTGTPSTASGDIADTATYLTYQGQGYSLKYVEGWGIQQGPGSGVTISDKDSSESVAVHASHSTPSAFAATDLTHLTDAAPRFHLIALHALHLPAGGVTYLQYRTLSAQDPVTDKRVPVIVDRYFIPGKGKVAVLTLSTPAGVDNVDAFRLIARSFRWR